MARGARFSSESAFLELGLIKRRAYVGKLIIRYRGGDAQDFEASTEESPASDAAAAKQVFEKMGEGRFAVFALRAKAPQT